MFSNLGRPEWWRNVLLLVCWEAPESLRVPLICLFLVWIFVLDELYVIWDGIETTCVYVCILLNPYKKFFPFPLPSLSVFICVYMCFYKHIYLHIYSEMRREFSKLYHFSVVKSHLYCFTFWRPYSFETYTYLVWPRGLMLHFHCNDEEMKIREGKSHKYCFVLKATFQLKHTHASCGLEG